MGSGVQLPVGGEGGEAVEDFPAGPGGGQHSVHAFGGAGFAGGFPLHDPDGDGLGLLRDWLHQAIDAGQIDPLPIDPLARLLAALVAEASLYIARAPNPAEARQQTGHTLDRILLGLRPRHD